MPLQKLKFKPGIVKEITTLSGEGGWFDGDKIRFRFGFPQKIGGWTALTYTSFLGVARSLWNWVTLNNYNLLGIGTNLKFYVESGGIYNDITPIRSTTAAGDITFAANTVTPSSIITVTDTAHGCVTNDFVTFYDVDVSGLGGNITQAVLQQEYQVTVVDNNSYTISAREVSNVASPGNPVLSNASDTGDGGANVYGEYQINTGLDIYTIGVGWGAGPWNAGASTDPWAHGWGTSFDWAVGYGLQLRLWSQINYGQDLLFSPRNGPLFIWEVGNGAAPLFSTRGTLVQAVDIPSQIGQIAVSDATRIVIAFGASEYGAYGTADFDPMLIRWSAQEDYLDWTPSATNQAGSYRLSRGSSIISSLQTRQEILVWTDAALYSMQYLGPPYVYGFNILSDSISIASPNVMVSATGTTFWMGLDKFYVYSGRVETLPCPVRQYVFENMNKDQAFQFFAGSNEGFSEIWWFYCSSNSTVIDRYVIFNYQENAWYYGELGRTAWLDSSIRSYPIAATTGNLIVYHETSVDDGTTDPPSPISSYIQSSDFDIGEGDSYGFVWRIIPDVTFDGSTTPSPGKPQVSFVLRPRKNPGSSYAVAAEKDIDAVQSYETTHLYNVQEFTQLVYTRARGRQLALKVQSNTLGTQWKLGVPAIDIRKDGRN